MGAVTSTTVSVFPPEVSPADVNPFTIRRHPLHQNGPYQNPPELQTMQDYTRLQFQKFGPKPYLGTRTAANGTTLDHFEFLTYSECEKIANNFGSGLSAKGIGRGTMFGIYSVNCPAWLHAIDVSSLYGLCIVSLYDSLGVDALSYLINHSKMQAILVSARNAEKFFSLILKDKAQVKTIILIDDIPASPHRDQVEQLGIEITTFAEVCTYGEAHPVQYPKIEPDDYHFICYSSGTTGNPKGVIISNKTAISNYLAASDCIRVNAGRYLSYLPLAHVFERAAMSVFSSQGGSIGFITDGDVRNLTTDMGILKPTTFCAVPRVMNRFYDGVQKQLQSPLKRAFFYGAWYLKRWLIPRSLPTGILDTLVFGKVNKLMGGCVEQFIVGGAALEQGVHEFLQVATGLPVRSGYGLTEAGSGNVCNPPCIRHVKPGTVGGPLQNCEVRLEPLPDYDDERCGEILLGGQCVCTGYLYDEAATAALFVDDDHYWIHTGDVGRWDEDNYLKVVDRMRSIFKLSQGEYVAAELVTQVFEESKLVSTIFVYGDSTRSVLVAVVVPTIGEVAKFVGQAELSQDDFARACRTPELKAAVMKQLDDKAKEHKLFGYQFIKNVYLSPEEWTTDNDLMTPTFKLKRKKLQERFQAQIEQMYAELP